MTLVAGKNRFKFANGSKWGLWQHKVGKYSSKIGVFAEIYEIIFYAKEFIIFISQITIMIALKIKMYDKISEKKLYDAGPI